jgi:hypothetical protein
MANHRHLHFLFLALACALAGALAAWDGNVNLNKFAVKDASGKITVLGTEGSWSDKGDVKEHVFDGDTGTFFDPPTSANQLGSAWAGIALTTSSIVTRVSYVGRSGQSSRMAGCLFQGANTPDFSDAETFHVISPPDGWNGTSWVNVTLGNAYGPYTYLRIIGLYCGNAGEVEFGGLAESGDAVPAAPQIEATWYLNQHAGFRLVADSDVPQVYRIQRRESAKDDYATIAIASPSKGGETCTWISTEKSSAGDYRVRGVNANGKGEWTLFTITSRVEAVGTWIGTEGSWNNQGDTGNKVFDGDPATFFDSIENSSAWTGLDLGRPQMIVGVRYVPRTGNSARMVGGKFEGANSPDFSDARTLYTIAERPTSGTITEVVFDEAVAGFYRYVRYMGPAQGHCNVSEVSFLLPEVNIDGPAAPSLSAPPGFSMTNVTVALDYPVEGAEIFYTLDGSTPSGIETENCFRYTAPLVFGDVSSRTNRLALIPTNPPEMWSHKQYGWAAPTADQPDVNVLRARAFKNGVACTNEVCGTWLIGSTVNGHTLRVVSLQTDEANFFSDATGLMVPGDVYNTLGWNGHSVGMPNANYFQHGVEWERPVAFELFETNREEVVAQTIGVRMHGNWSRSCAQKTMGFYARDEYGQKKLRYKLFGDEDHAEFKRFLLRNSGNDWYKSGLRDAFGQSLFRGWVSCGTQGYEPTVVYINGAYWGVMNFRHHYTKHYFEGWYGADPDNLDYVKMAASRGYEVQEGDDEAYLELLDFLDAHDLSTDAAAWEYVQTRIDIDNIVDYSIVNMFLCNTDWPHNNQGFWRERVDYSPTAAVPHDGRWRFVTFDTDTGLGLNSSVSEDMVGKARNHPFFKSLSDNPEFVRRLATRYADLMNSALVPARTTAMLDAAAARVRGEIARHVSRWTRQISVSNWESEISSIRSFLQNREANVRQNLNDKFGVGASQALTVAANGLGRIQVNTLSSGSGEGRISLPFTGRYFENVPVTLTATPETGWRFVAWVLDDGSEPRRTPSISLSVKSAIQATAFFVRAAPVNLVINEVMADADGSDWFEIYNAGAEEADLGGCWLCDDSVKHMSEIPLGVTLASGACLLVRADDTLLAGVDADGVLNVPFGLGKKGDEVNLWNAARTELLAHVAFGPQTLNVSEGCWPNGATNSWAVQTVATPGAPNRGPGATGAWLPDGVATQVLAGASVSLSCAVTNTMLAGSYSLVESPVLGAGISQTGLFTWRVPASARAGAYAFRVGWTSDDAQESDETTLIVTVVREEEVELPVPPVVSYMGATRIAATPLVYWAASPYAVSYTVERSSSRTGPYAVAARLGKGATTWRDRAAAGTSQTNWYRVVSTSALGLTSVTVPQRAWASGFAHRLEGDIIGTEGSWHDQGNTKEKLFDGNTSTFFDAPGNPAWGGFDLGTVGWRVVSQIRYWPRDSWADRMVNSRFHVSSVADFSTRKTVATISSKPPQKAWTTIAPAFTDTWRYVRWYADSGNGNAAEIEFTGFDGVPSAPASLNADTNTAMCAVLTWPDVANASGYLVWTNGVECAFVATNAATCARSSRAPTTFGVSAVNGSAQSDRISRELPPAPPPPFILFFR